MANAEGIRLFSFREVRTPRQISSTCTVPAQFRGHHTHSSGDTILISRRPLVGLGEDSQGGVVFEIGGQEEIKPVRLEVEQRRAPTKIRSPLGRTKHGS